MKIAVAVKVVPDPEVDPEVVDGVWQLADVKRVVDPVNEACVQSVLELRSGLSDAVVDVVSVGTASDKNALRHTLAMGVDEVLQLRLADELALAVDSLGVAKLLRRLLAARGYSLIAAGVKSSDNGSGQVGAALAGLLGWGCVSGVQALLEAKDGKLLAACDVGGRVANVWLSLPCVVVCDIKVDGPKQVDVVDVLTAKNKKLRFKTLHALNAVFDCGLRTANLALVPGARLSRVFHSLRDACSALGDWLNGIELSGFSLSADDVVGDKC
ncbi:putative electron transfer flavoprotein, beta subunit [Candidatus Hodgkinia cicadicola Dsem]|nr:putative electron transfer flavoprotein, beta subunit [Candidatus Hodgkinia cicadicola Dsem]